MQDLGVDICAAEIKRFAEVPFGRGKKEKKRLDSVTGHGESCGKRAGSGSGSGSGSGPYVAAQSSASLKVHGVIALHDKLWPST